MTQSTHEDVDAGPPDAASETPTVVGVAKERAAEAVDQVKSIARHRAETVRQRAGRAAEGKRLRAAGGVREVASAAHQLADGLREQQQPGVAEAVDRAADWIEDSADHLRRHDLTELTRQAADVARRHPVLVTAGGVALGLTAAHLASRWQHQLDRPTDTPSQIAREASESLEREGVSA